MEVSSDQTYPSLKIYLKYTVAQRSSNHGHISSKRYVRNRMFGRLCFCLSLRISTLHLVFFSNCLLIWLHAIAPLTLPTRCRRRSKGRAAQNEAEIARDFKSLLWLIRETVSSVLSLSDARFSLNEAVLLTFMVPAVVDEARHSPRETRTSGHSPDNYIHDMYTSFGRCDVRHMAGPLHVSLRPVRSCSGRLAVQYGCCWLPWISANVKVKQSLYGRECRFPFAIDSY